MRQAEPHQFPASPTFQFAPLLQVFGLSPLIFQHSIHPISFSGYQGACLKKSSAPSHKKFPVPSLCIYLFRTVCHPLCLEEHDKHLKAGCASCTPPSLQGIPAPQSPVCPRLALSSTAPRTQPKPPHDLHSLTLPSS